MSRTILKRRVLITGAAGLAGRILSEGLRDQYDLILIDIVPPPDDLQGKYIQADATDIELMQTFCEGVDTVVALAISGNLGSSWDRMDVNISGDWAALQAAVERGCRRVVLASSIKTKSLPERPYSSAKLRSERLGKIYAEHNALSVLSLRLGYIASHNDDLFFPGNSRLTKVLTDRDLVNLVTASIEAPDDLQHGIFWGTSANRSNTADLIETHRMLGYKPQDNVHKLAFLGLTNPRRIFLKVRRRIKRIAHIWKDPQSV